MSKQGLAWHRIPCPRFAPFPQGGRRAPPAARMRYPVIVKSVIEQGSAGIAQASVVKDDESVRERVDSLHTTPATDAVVEPFIDGRERTIRVVGHERLLNLSVGHKSAWRIEQARREEFVQRFGFLTTAT